MKFFVLLLCALSLAFPAERQGNFTIRFEPDAVLQTNTPVPFLIHVENDLHNPLTQATVTLQIELAADHSHVQVYKAPAVDQGVYKALPIFPVPGEWSVYVEVHRANEMSARTITFNVPE